MSSPRLAPIGPALQARVLSATRECLRAVEGITGHALSMPEVRFDLRGRCAGMYRVRGGVPEIRYNPWIFARHFDENLGNTVPHEVAHYAVDRVHRRRVRPHGREWQALMRALGVAPEATARFDLDGVLRRRYRTHEYRCACGPHLLTSIRHGRAQRGARYLCRACGTVLRQAGPVPGGAPV